MFFQSIPLPRKQSEIFEICCFSKYISKFTFPSDLNLNNNWGARASLLQNVPRIYIYGIDSVLTIALNPHAGTESTLQITGLMSNRYDSNTGHNKFNFNSFQFLLAVFEFIHQEHEEIGNKTFCRLLWNKFPISNLVSCDMKCNVYHTLQAAFVAAHWIRVSWLNDDDLGCHLE